MSVYLQFDSLARSNAFIKGTDGNWKPNDYRFNTQHNLNQTPANYSVFYKELNDCNNIRTLGRQYHCADRPENLTYSVEFCTLTLPACTRVLRPDGNVVSIADEPYIYIRIMPVENSEGTLIYTNNIKGGDSANFIAWQDRFLIGTYQNNATDNPPSIPDVPIPVSGIVPTQVGNPTFNCQTPQIVPQVGQFGFNTYRWITFHSCMVMPMRLNLASEQWQIRYSDRYGNDLVLYEENTTTPFGTKENPLPPPLPNPDLQTSILVGITPNYPVKQ